MANRWLGLVICTLLFQCLLQAQPLKSEAVLHGSIVDSVSGQPIRSAIVMLYKDTGQSPIKTTFSNDSGFFRFENVSSGNYYVKINSIGYKSKFLGYYSVSEIYMTINLGSIGLTSADRDLKEVVVTSNRETIEYKIDRFIYNSANNLTTSVGDAADLLRKIPMVTVDGNGNIALRGNRNVKILLDGKPTGAASGNIADLLQAIPASQIKNVEVITSPSAKYDADGGGIINIIIKKKSFEGISGSINSGIGTRQLTGSTSVTAKFHKLTLAVNGGINNRWPRQIGINAYSYSSQGDSSFSTGTTTNERFTNNIFGTLQYDFNEKNSFSSSFRSTSLGYTDDMHGESSSKHAGNTDSYVQSTTGKFQSAGFDWNSDYLLRFKRKGEELDFAAQWSRNTTLQNYQSVFSKYIPNEQGYNHGKNNEYTFQVDYALPFKNAVKMEAGIKNIYRNIESVYERFVIDSLGAAAHKDSLASNIYDYKQNVYSAYLMFNLSFKHGWEIQAGNRIELTHISGTSKNIFSGLLPFSNNYSSYIPGFIVMKKLKNNASIKLSYSKRIQRPSLQYLNPFKNTSDLLNQSQGTPDLAPENEQTIELAYNTNFKTVSFNTALYYKHTGNLIEGFTRPILYTTKDQNGNVSTRMVTLTSYGNIGTNNSFGLNLFASVDLTEGINIRSSVNFYTYNPKVDTGYHILIEGGTSLLYDGFCGVTYKHKKISIETTFNFESKWRTIQGTTANLNVYNIGIKREAFKGKGSIGVVVVNAFQDKWNFTNEINRPDLVSYRNLVTPFRSINLNISYRFGNFGIKTLTKRGVNNGDLK